MNSLENVRYPEKHERVVTADGVQQRLTDEIARLNDALDARFEDIRKLRHEADVQRGLATVAQSKLLAGNSRYATLERRNRDAAAVLTALVTWAGANPIYCDGVAGCPVCGSAEGETCKLTCAVRLAKEWIG